jgi:hypothetical protein
MVMPTDYISEFVYEKYVWPALERGDKIVTIDTGEVCHALHGSYSQNFVGAVLGSTHFRETYRVTLESAEIAATETYTFGLDVGEGSAGS